MILENISLYQFRNYEQIKVEFSKGLNIFVGNNGQGKSNLLEALNLICTSESFRPIENNGLVKHQQTKSMIQSDACIGDLNYKIKIEIEGSKKKIHINDKSTNSQKLLEKVSCICFSPESLNAIKLGDEQRRILIDDWIILRDYKKSVLIKEFKKCLKTRNKILKNFANAEVSQNEAQALISAINPIYLNLCVELVLERLEAIKDILPHFLDCYKNITRQNVDISVEYVASDEKINHFSAEKVRELINERMRQLASAEFSYGSSLVGPHKHDITFVYNGNDSRFYCSQGQQRALILAFKMAQVVYHGLASGSYPILLLDDVLSELDSDKRASLIRFINEIKSQTFITTTDVDLPAKLDSQDISVLEITGGQIFRKA